MAQATKTTLHPLHDRVLVQRIEEEQARHGSIIIPDSAKEKPQEGKVIAVGKGKVNEDGKKTPLDVKAGDRVLFGKYSGQRGQAGRRGVHHHEGGGRPRHPRLLNRRLDRR